MSRTVAIDLGTSNSCVAAWDKGAAHIIPLPGRTDGLLPSVVTITPDGYVVGTEAIEMGKKREHRDYCFRRFKRLLAEPWHDDADNGPQTCEGPDGKTWLRGPGGPISPVELCSYIISELMDAAASYFGKGKEPTGAVICVPADFSTPQISAIEQAASMAGVKTVTILREPTAAATYYGLNAKKTQRIAVYDLGGGTFDVSIVQSGGGKVNVLAPKGNSHIGGADFDDRIVEYVATMWSRDYPDSDIMASDAAVMLMRDEAERVKIRLSTKDVETFALDDIDRTAGGEDLHMRYPIDLATFNALTASLVKSTIDICERSIQDIRRKDPNFTVSDIHDVVLVGGMTRVRAVRDAVAAYFRKEPRKDVSPEHVVALGGAIKAAIVDGSKPDMTIGDVTSHSISIANAKGVSAVLFASGTPFGSEDTFMLTNVRAGIDALSIRLLEGEEYNASDNIVIATYEQPINADEARAARVPLSARIDDSGRVHAWIGDRTILGDQEQA